MLTVKYSKLTSLFIILLAALIPSIAAPSAEMDVEHVVEQECLIKEQISNSTQLNISVSDISKDIKLNGSTVESLDCSKLESYTYPDTVSQSSSFLSTISFADFLLILVLPVSMLFILGANVGRRYSLEWREIGRNLTVTLATLTVSGLGILFMNKYLYQLDFILIPIAFLLFGSPFIASTATYYYTDKTEESDKQKISALIAFIFSIMIYWMVGAYLLLTTNFMV